MTFHWTTSETGLHNVILSLVCIALLFLIRYAMVRTVRRIGRQWSPELRKRWIRNIRSLHLAATLLALAYIWSDQIYAFAVSVFAIALALVLAVKELLLCIHGSWIRIRSSSYDVGDRIEVNGIRGDVINVNLLSTTILEIGPDDLSHQQTGRSICIPNSMLLNHPVTNESFLGDFLLHNIIVPLKRSDDWKRAREMLLQFAQEECAPYLEAARKKVRAVERRQTVDFPSVDPRVTVHLPDEERLDLILRIPTPTHLKGRTERLIIDRFLDRFELSCTTPEPKLLQ